jgi:hydrogenase maturation factor
MPKQNSPVKSVGSEKITISIEKPKSCEVSTCQYGIVLRIPITAIPLVQKAIEDVDGSIIYQRMTAGKLWIMDGERPAGV